MELLRKAFAFGKWALVGGGLYQVLQPEGLSTESELLSDIIIVVGIPFFFIFGIWLLCLNWVKLRKRGFVQSMKDEWFDIKARTGTKMWCFIGSLVAFFCVALVPAYISKEVIGRDPFEAPMWEQAFVGVGLLGFMVSIFAALIISGNKTDKD